MNQFLTKIPRPLFVLVVLILGIFIFWLIKPPHTICDVYKDNFELLIQGKLTPKRIDKKTFPAKVLELREACLIGATSGACYDYFHLLKDVLKEVQQSPSECIAEVIELKPIYSELFFATKTLIQIAWGSKAPDPGPEKLGSLQEYEIALFCKIKSIYSKAHGLNEWDNQIKKIYAELPYDSSKETESLDRKPGADSGKAIQYFSFNEMNSRSLNGVPCQAY